MRYDMNKTVWKFPLDVLDGPQGVEMPEGAEILCVDEQDMRPVMWAEVNPDAPMVARRFMVHGTGEKIEQGYYVGTMVGVPFVWHVYELASKPVITKNPTEVA